MKKLFSLFIVLMAWSVSGQNQGVSARATGGVLFATSPDRIGFSHTNGIILGDYSDAANPTSTVSMGSISIGDMRSSSNSRITSTSGGFSGAASRISTNSRVHSYSGIAVGVLESSTNNSLQAYYGSFSGANAANSSNVNVISLDGSFAGGDFTGLKRGGISADNGSFGGAQFSSGSEKYLVADGSLVSVQYLGASPVYLSTARSMIVGGLPGSSTNTFESTVAVLGANGEIVGFTTNGFFGNGAGLTNLNANSVTGMVENVVYYGADKTGSAQSYSAFTNAIAQAAVSGYPVYVPAGTYSISNNLTLAANVSNLKVFGDGRGKSVLNFTVAAGQGRAFEFPTTTGMTNFTFQGLTIQGATKGGTNLSYCIMLSSNVSQVVVRDCEIRNSLIGVGSSHAQNNNHGLVVEDCTIADCGPGSIGYIFGSGNDIKLRRNTIDDSTSGNTNNVLQHAIYLTAGNNLEVVDNSCLGTNAGIQIYNSDGRWSTNAIVSRNNVRGSHGSYLYYLVGSQVSENLWTDGLVKFANSLSSSFRNNEITQATNAAPDDANFGSLFFGSALTNCVIADNTIIGFTTNAAAYGLQVGANSDNCEIANNVIRGFTTQLYLTGGRGHSVYGNSVAWPTQTGTGNQIYLAGASNCVVFGNVVATNGPSIFALRDTTGLSRFVNNYLTGGTISVGGSAAFTAGGLLFSAQASQNQTGASAIGLITNTIPANTVRYNGDVVEGVMGGTFAANSNAKRLQLYLNTGLLYDSGAANAPSGGFWSLNYSITRTGDTTVRAVTTFGGDILTITNLTQYVSVGHGGSFASALVLKVTATGVSDNDITQTYATGSFKPLR